MSTPLIPFSSHPLKGSNVYGVYKRDTKLTVRPKRRTEKSSGSARVDLLTSLNVNRGVLHKGLQFNDENFVRRFDEMFVNGSM